MGSRNVVTWAMLVPVLLFSSMNAYSQVSGQSAIRFLNAPPSARLAGLGGINVSLADRDVTFVFTNPALNGDTLSGLLSVGYQFYVADIGQASFAFAPHFGKLGMVTVGIQHMNYGSITEYDASGNETGKFNAQESLVNISRSHQIGHYRFGVSLKGIFSSLGGYRATAVAVDLGALFMHPDRQLTIGLALKNLGLVVSDYSESAESTLPFDVQLGTTFKPEHMPLRFSITVYDLADISNDESALVDEGGSTLVTVLNHFNFGGELLFHKNVNLLLGYNYLNHRYLKLPEGGAGAGLSAGLSLTIKSFDFVFSRAGYAAGSASYSFSLSANINRFLKRT
jgi:hypothetical protein